VHAEGEEHETPLKKSPVPSVPGGVTADCTVQVVPFQRSASSPISVVPTAVQAEAEVHETAFNVYPGLCELGDGCRVHVVPSHRSATVPSGLNELSATPPTAVHAFAEVHDTPFRELIGAPAGVGIGWMLQLFPSHLSAITCPSLLFPTAVHALGEVQETAFNNDTGLAEVGVGWMLQRVPSQRSVTVPPVGGELPTVSKPPTAKQAEGDVHDTPSRPLLVDPAGLGVGAMRQAVPFQSSASVPPVDSPTATQDEDDLHDTPRSCAPRAPCGLTVCSALHWVPSHAWPRVMTVPEASNPSPTAMQESS
jgi:hypothetical protein